MSQDLARIIDGICREKNIEREDFLGDLENALLSAVRREYGEDEEVEVRIDRLSCDIKTIIGGRDVPVTELGRIPAQTAKQVIIQKTRERERVGIHEEFTERRGSILTGTVVRVEGNNLLVNIGRTEGFLPRSERIPGETHQVGERIRVMILEVREQGNQVKVVLTRSHPDFIMRLFELEVPEVAERIIEVRALAREAGYRTKVAVTSIDTKVDAVGACVGVRGSRIKNIVDELSGEKIDIVRWNESSQILIQNALKPAEVQEIALCFELGKASVVVADDQLSLAIGKRGQNVRLAARLTKWDIDILTPIEYNKNLENMERIVKSVGGTDDLIIDKLVAIGCVSVRDVDDVGPEVLVSDLELDADLAEKIVYECGEEVIRIEEEKEAAAKAKAAGLPVPEPAKSAPSGFVPTDSAAPQTEAAKPADSSDGSAAALVAAAVTPPEPAPPESTEPAASESPAAETAESSAETAKSSAETAGEASSEPQEPTSADSAPKAPTEPQKPEEPTA